MRVLLFFSFNVSYLVNDRSLCLLISIGFDIATLPPPWTHTYMDWSNKDLLLDSIFPLVDHPALAALLLF